MDIRTYKDGSDIIVVFKNASDDILNTISTVFGAPMPPTIVPDLDPPPEESGDHNQERAYETSNPEKIRSFQDFISAMVEMKTYGTDQNLKRLCQEFYESHNKILADIISTLELNRVRGFVRSCYQLHDELPVAFFTSGYPTIDDFVEDMTESDLRSTAKEIGGSVVSFFEAIE